jgi:hypothetical protein
MSGSKSVIIVHSLIIKIGLLDGLHIFFRFLVKLAFGFDK